MKKPDGVKIILFLLITFAGISTPTYASSVLQLQQVDDNVYAIVGPLANRTPENLGNNATFGFVVTSEGVVLIDSGGTMILLMFAAPGNLLN